MKSNRSLHLVNLFHSRFFVVIVIAIKWRQVFHVVISCIVIVVIDRKSKLDQSVDTRSKGGRFVQGESRCQKRGVVQQPDQVLHGLIGLIGICFFAEGNDDRVCRVHFHGLLRHHVGGLCSVTEGLCLHDTFHVSTPSVFSSDQDTRRVGETVGDNDLLHFITKDFLHELAKRLGLRLGFLIGSLFSLILVEVKTFLGGRQELLSFVLLELLDGIFINWVDHEQDFVSLLLEFFKEWRSLDCLVRFTCDVVDARLVVFHATDIVVERSHLFTRLGRLVA
mmetsp:Transcript_32551/g.54504  ORF Transcript_32551/g.54504 Transcript_32551/m.54504 type:complete len:279 (-) Transcript_32551:1427-2263(-)